ncbi:MAG: permease-like cell division protein FtsX [bacterium]
MFSRIEFIIAETFQGIRRHLDMAFAAIACVVATMLIIGMVALLQINADYLIKNTIERVRFMVYFQPETSRDEALGICKRIGKLNGVASTEFIPKEDAWENYKKQYTGLDKLLGRNPLPDAISVKPINIENIEEVKTIIEGMPEVDKVQRDQDVSNYLIAARSNMQTAGWMLGILLALLAFVIIHHSIELTIVARRKEVVIMMMVGATPATVGLPFIIEGLIYGFIGSILAVVALKGYYGMIAQKMLQTTNTHLWNDSLDIFNGGLILIICGTILGFVASMAAVVKFLIKPKSKITNA